MSLARLLRTTLAAALLSACAQSHLLPRDGAAEDASSDLGGGAGAADAGGAPDVGGASAEGLPCGPNRCFDGEVCCRASCGLCADADACLPDLPCRRSEVVCGGVVCDPPANFCCSTCEGEVCPGAGLRSRAECDAVTCE